MPKEEPGAGGSDSAEPTVPKVPTPAPTEAPVEEAPAGEDWETRFKYVLADFENFRKRSEREREAALRSGRARVLRSLLPLWEAFDRAGAALQRLPAQDPLRAGFDLMRKEWELFLKAERVEPVARVGEEFRPEEHEAVAEAPPTPAAREGRVAEIVQQGYRSDFGLLRPAKVVVARRPVPTPDPAATETRNPPAQEGKAT